jgi:hypothetical protein
MSYPAITSRGYWWQVGRYDMEPGLLWAIRITSFRSLSPSWRAPRKVSRDHRGAGDRNREPYFLPLLFRLAWARSQTAMASRVMPPLATPVMNSMVSDAGLSDSR